MKNNRYLARIALLGGIICLIVPLFAGCRPAPDPLVMPHNESSADASTINSSRPAAIDPTVSPQLTSSPTPLDDPTSVPTLAPWRIGQLPNLPAEITQLIFDHSDFDFVETTAEADLVLLRNDRSDGEVLFQTVYAAVGPFATLRDTVSIDELQLIELVADPQTALVWQSAYPHVTAIPAEEIEPFLWANREAIAIVPFEALTPALKALPIEGQSVLERNLDLTVYPLVDTIYLYGDSEGAAQLLELLPQKSNRHEDHLTRLAMTGVTALVRATAAQMEVSGVLFPGEEVAPLLQMADIAHISNEVPFAEQCPYPDATSQSLIFCSRDHYFELLTHLGADVIEVTGNHSNDYGPDSMVRSLDLYEAAGMVYYGGGRNLSDALAPAVFTDHGNQIAFVGCNPVGPVFAWATENRAGAAPCHDYAQLEEHIRALREEGYLVVATLQYQEIYSYGPTANQVRDFGRLAAAGATIVSGSQSHHPQAFALQYGSFIHYGLGNLFFDQMDQLGTRQMFVDTYVIYEGQLLNVELWTGLIEFYARPRPMTARERAELLNAVFAASGW